MLQLKNRTPFAATILSAPDCDGIESMYAIVKGTFTIGTNVAIAEEQIPISIKDQFNGEPGKSSIRIPSDISLPKSATDVLLVGNAYAPNGRPVYQMDVGLALGPIRVVARVIGDRIWQHSAMGVSLAGPQPFETMPLVWERAFGGTDQTVGSSPEFHAENRNPAGTGFCLGNGKRVLDGLALPNIEHPSAPVSKWNDRPMPVNFGPVSPHWEPRRNFAGTYDDAWQKNRSPYLPKDFDPRFFQVAPAYMIAPGYLQGGEPVDIRGASPAGDLRFSLPNLQVNVGFNIDGTKEVRPANMDTVIIEPDFQRLTLIWRAGLQCDKKSLRVREVEPALVEG